MNETTMQTELAVPVLQSERLCSLLQTASLQLQSGEDAEGIEGLLAALSELEELVENDQNSSQPQIDLNRLLPAMRMLHFYIKNQDVAGIGDLLEDVFYPMAGECVTGSDGV